MILLDVDLIYDKYDEYIKSKEELYLREIASEIANVYMTASSETLRDISVKIDENMNFYRGNHWIYYDNMSSKYRAYGKTKANKDIPQETTNYVGVEVDSIVSLLTRTKENIIVVPNSTDAEDINKAKIGEAILEGNYYLNNELLNKINFVKLAVLCGTVYRKDYWDTNILTTDSKGKIITGETATKILSPLEIIPDYQNAIKDIDDGRYVIEFGYYPISQVKNQYNRKEPGYTGFASKISEDNSTNTQIDALQKLKDPLNVSEKNLKKYTVVMEVYLKPTLKHKKGLMVVCTNKEVLYIEENKVYNQFGGKFWSPYTMCRYKIDPFNHYGISLPELIIPLNKSINSMDSLATLNRATMAAPKTFIPQNWLAQGQELSGRPGGAYTYKQGTGEKIFFEYGKPLDQSVATDRQQKVMDISKISGSNEVLQGNRPAGVNTSSGLNMLLEQSFSKFNTTVFEIENALSKAYTKVLNLKRYCYQEPREDYMNRVRAINNSVTKIAIKDFFTGADLGNNIDVRVESGSSSPKSLVMERMDIKEVAQMGVFGPLDPIQNPIGNKYFLTKFGLGKFSTPTNNDTTRASWENDLIRNGKFNEAIVMPVDNNVIHYQVLNEEIKKPDFYDTNSKEVCEYYWKHLCDHFQAMTEQEIMMAQISPQQMQELDIMSVNMGVIGEEELMYKRGMIPPPGQAMIGQDPNMQNVPLNAGQMPNDSNMGTQQSA